MAYVQVERPSEARVSRRQRASREMQFQMRVLDMPFAVSSVIQVPQLAVEVRNLSLSPLSHSALLPRLFAHRDPQVACGTTHSLALSSTGMVASWGFGTHGQLGLGRVDRCEPRVLTSLQDGVRVLWFRM